jgi:RNA polymerase sigma-70 factor (sigma-E family)
VRVDPSFDAFVEAQSGPMLRFAYLLTGDRGHAEDLLQTALLRTMRHWPRARQAPEAYTRQVLVNLSRDRIRGLRRRPLESELPDEHQGFRTTDPGLERIGEGRAVSDLVARLPIQQRRVIVLRFFADLSIEQTAQELDCSTGTVKTHTARALSRLRELLDDHEPSERTKVTHDQV